MAMTMSRITAVVGFILGFYAHYMLARSHWWRQWYAQWYEGFFNGAIAATVIVALYFLVVRKWK